MKHAHRGENAAHVDVHSSPLSAKGSWGGQQLDMIKFHANGFTFSFSVAENLGLEELSKFTLRILWFPYKIKFFIN